MQSSHSTGKKKNRLKWALIITLLLAAGGGYAWKVKSGDAAPDTPAYRIVDVRTDTIEDTVTAQGKLEPKEYVDVGAQVSGQLKKLYVEIGDNVKKGDPIAEIDAKIYESEVAGNEARLKTLRAQRGQNIAEVNQAKQKRDRNLQLIQSQAISREVYEDAETALKVAQAQLSSLDAQIEEAESTLEGNKANLNYTRIFAPMDGTVVVQSAREGQTLNANQTAPTIVQLANLDTMTVRAQVAEADIIRLTVDMPVYFTTLGSGERRWQGKVRQILPSPETINDVVLYNVLVDVGNEDRQLMTGMSTQMFFELGRAENIAVIPAAALMKRVPAEDAADGRGKAYEVTVPGAGKGFDRKTILVGLSDRNNAEVISGLAPGDKVALPAVQGAGTQNQNTGRGGMRGMPRL